MRSVDDLGARHRDLRAVQKDGGFAAFGDAPLLVVRQTIFGRRQHVSDRPQPIECDIPDDGTGSRLLKSFEKFTVGPVHHGAPVRQGAGQGIP